MPAEYTRITNTEMRALLQPLGFVVMDIRDTHEIVYGCVVRKEGIRSPFSLRVYTTIANGAGRNVGEDAIRVGLFVRKPVVGQEYVTWPAVPIGWTTRTHRTQNWRVNLLIRCHPEQGSWRVLIGDVCPSCGMFFVKRESKYGVFWGCINFPACKQTRPYKGEQA